MGWANNGACHRRGNRRLRRFIWSCAAIAATLTVCSQTAHARHHWRGHVHLARRLAGRGTYAPPTASIVVDGNTGAVLEQSNPDALRHPASLTKVMTLYLLFEQLDAGKLTLDTRLYVSEHAAEQAPTKLGLEPGQAITVGDAIRGIVTRSANDAAVAIAENLGGSEAAFAKAMTEKAHELGMTHTNYVNASGLPDDDQVTTARDQALLGRAIRERFPRYYPFFSTTSFVFRGDVIRGHDHLLGAVAGVDGIKTGYTRASGFNLLTSVHRGGRYLVAVVLGGRTAAERDTRMRALIAANIELAAAAPPPVPRLARQSKSPPQRAVLASAFAPAAAAAPAPPAARAAVGSDAPIRPVVVKTITYRTVTVPARPMAPMAAPAAPAPSPVAAAPQGPAPRSEGTVAAEPAAAPGTSRAGLVEAGTDVAAADPAAVGQLHGGWMIQIGAFDGEQAARAHLDAAKAKVPALAAAEPFTEPVHRGDTTLYRARFSGLDKNAAENDCLTLRRSDVPCMALKN